MATPPPAELHIVQHRQGDTALLALDGELDVATAPRFAAELESVVRQGEGAVEIDLRDLRFIDSAGLHVLLNAQRRLVRRRRRLRVVCASGQVLRALELARLVETLGVVVP